MPEAADSGLDGDRKENHSMLPSSGGKRKKAVAGGHVVLVPWKGCIVDDNMPQQVVACILLTEANS